ncbi:MAG: hypothetical protein ACK5L8_08245 [Marinicella pacifica]
MDPFTLLISLAPYLINYAQEKREQSKYSLEDFQDWLKENNNEILKYLENNQSALIGIKAILNENHDTVLSEFENLKRILAASLTTSKVGSDLVSAIDPSIALPEQAIDILKQMNKDNVTSFLELHHLGGKKFIYMGAPKSGNIEIIDERFIDDDLDNLVELGFLSMKYNDQGKRLFTITRKGGEVK